MPTDLTWTMVREFEVITTDSGTCFSVRSNGLFLLYPNVTKEIQEETEMKTAAYRTSKNVRPAIPFPNAATRRQMVQKFLDFVLMSAISLGIAATDIFPSSVSIKQALPPA